ncbi:MAG: lysophospholipid acyltransferase family protein [Phycisphaerales bacterium]|nr:lysophospholipid acyltransferase family protein [Phycisphaerales bacterium]
MKKDRGPVAYAAYLAFRFVSALLHLAPIDRNLSVARSLARGWQRLMPRHHERAVAHLRSAYGTDLSDAQLHDIARRCLEHWTMFAVELIRAPALIRRDTWHRYLVPVNLEETLRHLLAGRGAILLAGHFGNWELLGHLLACFGFRVSAVMRPLDNVYLNRHLVRTRATHGLELLDKEGATAEAEALLQRGRPVAFIADQDAGRKGLFVDFFGRPASTYKSIGLLAMHARVPVIVGYARRLGDCFRYEVAVERFIRPEEWEEQPDPLRWITQTYTSAIESAARRDPAQYLWIHRRWKSQPKRTADKP